MGWCFGHPLVPLGILRYPSVSLPVPPSLPRVAVLAARQGGPFSPRGLSLWQPSALDSSCLARPPCLDANSVLRRVFRTSLRPDFLLSLLLRNAPNSLEEPRVRLECFLHLARRSPTFCTIVYMSSSRVTVRPLPRLAAARGRMLLLVLSSMCSGFRALRHSGARSRASGGGGVR